ncbi:MAG: RNB domain-containing ribonuclease [Caldilineaceae bacterium]
MWPMLGRLSHRIVWPTERARGVISYLPEGTIHMLPADATAMLGLGLQERSPALSFRLRLNEAAEIQELTITPSWIRVTRLSYEEAEQRLDEPIFAELYALAARLWRAPANGAIELTCRRSKSRLEGEGDRHQAATEITQPRSRARSDVDDR